MRRTLAIILSMFVVMVGVGVQPAAADHGGYVSDKYYSGTRFKSSTICVQLKTNKTWLKDRVKEAAGDWDDHTKLRMFVKEDCSGYNRIKIVGGYYGKDATCGGHKFVGCFEPGTRTWTKTSKGHWTYTITYAKVRLNYSNLMGLSTAQKDSAITHEFGHLGLVHIQVCGSVMRSDWKCMVRESGDIDRKSINNIYSQ